MRTSKLLTAGFLAFLCAGCDRSPTGDGPFLPRTGRVEGTVTQIDAFSPPVGATIALFDPVSLRMACAASPVDSLGEYSVAAPAGEYAVVLYHHSLVIYERPRDRVRVEVGRTTRHDLKVQRSGLWDGGRGRVTGVITDATSGLPISGAAVSFSGLGTIDIIAPFFGTTLPEMRVTDVNGRFSLAASPITVGGGGWLVAPVCVTKAGYEPYSIVGRSTGGYGPFGPWLPMRDSVLALDIRLHPTTGAEPRGAVRGRLTFAGQPVAGIRVGLSLDLTAAPDTIPATRTKAGGPEMASPLPDRTALSSRVGIFVIDDVPLGQYAVVAAYQADDGYVAGWMRRGADVEVSVAAGAVVEVGDIELAKALHPVHPENAATSVERMPVLEWEPLDGLPSGYTFVDYILSLDNDYPLDIVAGGLRTPRWPVPARLFPNANMRWIVDARAFRSATQDTVVLGTFERAATFTVGADVDLRVLSAAQPAFDWTPTHGMGWLLVEDTEGRDLWSIETRPDDHIVPPIRYGRVPAGVVETTAAHPLEAGSEYVVYIGRVAVGESGIAAWRVFTPP